MNVTGVHQLQHDELCEGKKLIHGLKTMVVLDF
jgi:hypothetical protein